VKILIANRGEIAVRVIRACREMGLATVAVYSECDRTAPHVRFADHAFSLGPNEASASYLNISKIIDVARRARADAVHPGYGFLAENATFARACADARLLFIGPRPDVIDQMGSKTAARHAATAAGVPVVPGTQDPLPPDLADADVKQKAAAIGYPLLVKAVAGGGGKGMRTVQKPDGLLDAIRTARSEAASAFADPSVYFERVILKPRHIEVQLLGDEHGTVVAFVERECSLQRRHQKVVEESPSPVVTPTLRERMTSAAAALARSVGYTNAGTIEFLVDDSGEFYFLEMNTRLQVEHPVTELVTGVDLVQWQIRTARGERVTLDPERLLQPHGHAIECRVYAEDPNAGFLPSPGTITSLQSPSGPGIREDSGVAEGFTVPMYYDSMVAKLVAWAEDRDRAIDRLRRAFDEYEIGGIRTTVPFFRWLVRQDDFRSAAFDTTYLDRLLATGGISFTRSTEEVEEIAAIAAALDASSRVALPSHVAVGGWRRAARLEGLRD
jgi:acetyl-CoA carboxylase, biotin carboxylase subunit